MSNECREGRSENPYTDAQQMAQKLSQDVQSYMSGGSDAQIWKDIDKAKCGGYFNDMAGALIEKGLAQVTESKNFEPKTITFPPINGNTPTINLEKHTLTP